MRRAIVFLALSGCVINENQFAPRAIDASCNKAIECGTLDDDQREACENSLTAIWDVAANPSLATQVFDPKAAHRCVTDLENLTCDQGREWPSSCQEVYE